MKKGTVILVAEDEAGHFELVKRNLWLSCVENEILHFSDGQEILDFLAKEFDSQNQGPGRNFILLLDIRMPKIDGHEVLRRVKSDKKLNKIPVIILTTTSDTKEIDLCYQLGCSFYMVKPVDYTRFMDSVENLGRFLSLDGIRLPKLHNGKK
ncbi:MAG: response regulator [Planctomycetota bacterium]|jgi:CheY-like chemotaxis protein